MSLPASEIACTGCGWRAPAGAAAEALFRCPEAAPGDDVDHLLTRVLDPSHVAWPGGSGRNPFLHYRVLLHAYHAARAAGLDDVAYCTLVDDLDRAVRGVDGRGFAVTPCASADALAAQLGLNAGRLWVKDETGNVSGSHKARHLIGILLHLRVTAALAQRRGEGATPAAGLRLAIASCGNAALAAAVLARAAALPLEVFVPEWAEPVVLGRLRDLAATITICPRSPGVAGDPCYHRFREVVRDGAVPFCCQGPDNGLTIEGGSTLAWELVDALGEQLLDRLFVQVGGGALASACAQGFADAVRLGRIGRPPRLHAVQTAGGHPLARAYELLLARILERLGGAPLDTPASGPARAAALADFVRASGADAVAAELRNAAAHRSQLMWPWESEPKSLATGILDDETYDWLAIVAAMLGTGGWPVVVDEPTVAAAHQLGRRSTGIDVDPTGTAGLAGLMQLRSAGLDLAGETVAVLFTGARRG